MYSDKLVTELPAFIGQGGLLCFQSVLFVVVKFYMSDFPLDVRVMTSCYCIRIATVKINLCIGWFVYSIVYLFIVKSGKSSD